MRSKLLGLALIGAVGCVTAGWQLLARYKDRHIPRFPYLAAPLSTADYDALAVKPRWEKSQLDVETNIQLRGLIRRPSGTARAWVLYFPGNDRTQLATSQSFLDRLAPNADVGLAIYAYRGYDGSDGTTVYDRLASDAPRILTGFCRQQRLEPKDVHVVGFSIGAHFAAMASRQASLSGQPVRSLSLLGCANDVVLTRPTPWQQLSPGDRYRTEPLLARGPARVLVLQGTDDEALGGVRQARDVVRALGSRAEYQEFEGVGHEALLAHEPALVRLREFLPL